MTTELTAPEKVYLAAFDLQRDRLSERRWVDYLVQGAALADLLLDGAISETDKLVQVSSPHSSDPILDFVLTRAAQEAPRSWKSLLHDSAPTLRVVEDHLNQRGVIRGHGRRVVLVDRQAVAALQAKLERLLSADAAAATSAPADALVLAVASVVPLRTLFSRRNKSRDEELVAEVVSRLSEQISALGTLLKQMRHTRGASFSAGGPVH